MTITLNGTTGITTPDITSAAGLDAADLTGTVSADRLAAGSIEAVKLAANGAWTPSKSVVSINVFRDGTRRSMPGQQSYVTPLGGTFTKLRSDTLLIATCTALGAGFQSGNCGVGLRLDNDSFWDYGIGYQYDGAWSQSYQTTIITGHHSWTGIAAGLHTINFGWNSVNAGAEKPFHFMNANASDDARNRQMISSIFVYEVAP